MGFEDFRFSAVFESGEVSFAFEALVRSLSLDKRMVIEWISSTVVSVESVDAVLMIEDIPSGILVRIALCNPDEVFELVGLVLSYTPYFNCISLHEEPGGRFSRREDFLQESLPIYQKLRTGWFDLLKEQELPFKASPSDAVRYFIEADTKSFYQMTCLLS